MSIRQTDKRSAFEAHYAAMHDPTLLRNAGGVQLAVDTGGRPHKGLPGSGRDGAKVKKFHNFATDDAPSTLHRCTSITPPPRALDEILHLTWAKLPLS